MNRERISVWRTAWFAPLLSLTIVIIGSYLVIRDGAEHRRQHDARITVVQAATQQHIERLERLEQLVREGAKDEFLEGVDPQDAALWSALLPYAALDEQCNALPECTQDTMHIARPITVQVRSKYSDAAYVAVLGIEAWTPHGHGIIPRITYYVGSQGGALWRMRTGATQAEVRTPFTDEWREVESSASDFMRNEVRTAFIGEWQRRLNPSRAQAL